MKKDTTSTHPKTKEQRTAILVKKQRKYTTRLVDVKKKLLQFRRLESKRVDDRLRMTSTLYHHLRYTTILRCHMHLRVLILWRSHARKTSITTKAIDVKIVRETIIQALCNP